MDHKLLLAKSVTLLYRESLLPERSDNSADLIRTVLEDVKTPEAALSINGEKEIIHDLKATILEMCGNPLDHDYSKGVLLQRIRINTHNDDKLYEAIRGTIEDEMSDASIKRSIVSLRKAINNHFRDNQIGAVINKAGAMFKFDREKIKSVSQFVQELIAQLEPLSEDAKGKDPAVMGDVDLSDANGVTEVFKAVQERMDGAAVYQFGWKALNRMTQGGIRPGETMVVGALQHKYKTGFTLSLFGQLARYNKPRTTDPTKKPLLLRISFEDDLTNNLQFLYQQLKYTETREHVDVRGTSPEEMQAYIKEKLQVNGFHVKMIRVDPSQWTYKSIFNKIIELEAQGYVVEILMCDYLSKVPTTGCITTGAMGNDVQDLLNRVRNFCASKDIAFITPHQLATDAKQLLRGTMTDAEFVKFAVEKGFWEHTKGLDRVFDLGVLIHLFKSNGHTYFCVGRDKHRYPGIIDDKDRYYYQKFPKGMPIPDDLMDEVENSRVRMGAFAATNADADFFAAA